MKIYPLLSTVQRVSLNMSHFLGVPSRRAQHTLPHLGHRCDTAIAVDPTRRIHSRPEYARRFRGDGRAK